MNYIDTILEIQKNNPKNFSRIIQKDPILSIWIDDQVKVISNKYAEKIYLALYPNSNVCNNGHILTFNSFNKGYNGCSQIECYSKNMSESIKKQKALVSVEQQHQANEKRKLTVVSKFGVENVAQLPNVVEKRKQTNLEIYGVDNAAKSAIIQTKIKATNVEKHGVENPFQSTNIKDKIKATNIEKYGVENPSQSPNIISKRKETNLKKYGVVNPMNQSYVLEKNKIRRFVVGFNNIISRSIYTIPLFDISQYTGKESEYDWQCKTCDGIFKATIVLGSPRLPLCAKCHPNNKSLWELEIKNCFPNETIISNTKQLITPKEIDLYFPTSNFAIECDGEYHHSELAGKGKNYHLDKTKLCEQKGIQLIHIWENEWKYKNAIVKSKIHSLLGLNKKLFARKCELKTVTIKERDEFLDNNHLQGTSPSSINLGLYYQNELIAIMTFSKARFTKKYEWELIRYCSKTGINVVGGAGKLLTYFIKNYNPLNIVTYADRRWSQGKMYQTLGFTFKHFSPPSYTYTKDYILLENRRKYQKKLIPTKFNLFDINLTEWENMQLNGYDRIWDCGTSVWIWKQGG